MVYKYIRIPIKRNLHYVNKPIYEINFNFMDRVEEVVNFVYNNSFKKIHIIISIYHNNFLLNFSGNNSENQNMYKEIKLYGN